MKGLAIFITSLFVTMSVSAQTEVGTDSIDTSAFDKYLDEIVIVAKKPGTVVKTDRKSLHRQSESYVKSIFGKRNSQSYPFG